FVGLGKIDRRHEHDLLIRIETETCLRIFPSHSCFGNLHELCAVRNMKDVRVGKNTGFLGKGSHIPAGADYSLRLRHVPTKKSPGSAPFGILVIAIVWNVADQPSGDSLGLGG